MNFYEFIKHYAQRVEQKKAKPLTLKQYEFAKSLFQYDEIVSQMGQICDLTYVFEQIEIFIKHNNN